MGDMELSLAFTILWKDPVSGLGLNRWKLSKKYS